MIDWIGWQEWNASGDAPGRTSKRHAFADGSDVALCGKRLSATALDSGLDIGHGECKRCAKNPRAIQALDDEREQREQDRLDRIL